jgi:hypothetical protein
MRSKLSVATMTAAALLGTTSVARADINEVVEGTYSAECQALTLSAGIFDSSCESEPGSFLCSAAWVGEPFEVELKCGIGDLVASAGEIYEQCMATVDLKVISSDGTTAYDVGAAVCKAAKGALMRAATAVETMANGTFTIDVATHTWLSTMSGTFDSQNGVSTELRYLTASFPWSTGFGFAMASGIPGRVSLDGVCDGAAALSLLSSGNVEKSTGDLALAYNLNGTLSCGELDGEALSVTVNLHADVAGHKLH